VCGVGLRLGVSRPVGPRASRLDKGGNRLLRDPRIQTTFDLDAVLQTVVDRAVDLCDADSGNITRRDGDVFRMVAFTSFSHDFEQLVRELTYRPERGSVVGRALLEGRAVQILDVLEDPEYELAEGRRISWEMGRETH
jgi:GAF domain-containing protein